jgi:23S rRNA (cytidine1920-2'-O)/16S rRNA (cytidine1409-2'-O)-methyltransferase
MTRLDILITEKRLVKSRSVALDLIKKGLVLVNGEIVTKPAKDISDSENTKIEIVEQPKYVGRGGLKLEKALAEFLIEPTGLICLDVGSSTGGFTDCLLQAGAKKVYAVDVGTDQFDSELKKDSRIILLEKTDIREIEKLDEVIDLAVIDVSFISLELILEAVRDLVRPKGKIIALVKPQFETNKNEKNKSGIVRTTDSQERVLEKIKAFAKQINLKVINEIDSPILGGSGNKEYLILLEKID